MPDIEKQLEDQSEPEDIFEAVEKIPEKSQDILKNSEVKPVKEKQHISLKNIIRLTIIIIIIIVIGIGIFYLQDKTRRSLSSKQESLSTPITESKEPEPAVVPLVEPQSSDLDKDGLSDIEEDELGTDKNNPDSDNDGLFDKEEVKVYLTDPLNPDSDGDGILDGIEVDQGKDPKDADPNAMLLDIQKEINKFQK